MVWGLRRLGRVSVLLLMLAAVAAGSSGCCLFFGYKWGGTQYEDTTSIPAAKVTCGFSDGAYDIGGDPAPMQIALRDAFARSSGSLKGGAGKLSSTFDSEGSTLGGRAVHVAQGTMSADITSLVAAEGGAGPQVVGYFEITYTQSTRYPDDSRSGAELTTTWKGEIVGSFDSAKDPTSATLTFKGPISHAGERRTPTKTERVDEKRDWAAIVKYQVSGYSAD